MPHIPQEIIDAIIDQLAGLYGSYTFWKTCALVSKSFRLHSQTLLFRSITIHMGRMASLSRLHAVLQGNPHLATHVRELSLSIRLRELLGMLEMPIMDTLTRFTETTSCSCLWLDSHP